MERPARYGSIVWSLAILLVGTALAVTAAWLLGRGLSHEAENRFMRQARLVQATLGYRLEGEQARVFAARGFYLASDDITPSDWQHFAAALYAGSGEGRALMHMRYAPASAKKDVIAWVAALGVPGAKVRPQPAGKNQYYCVVDRIWPAALRSRMLGLNPCASNELSFFSRAAAGGGLIVSRDIPLYVPQGVEHGIAFIAAIGSPANTSTKAGWVVETVPAAALFSDIVHAGDRLQMEILDISGGAAHVLYENHNTRLRSPSAWQHILSGARIERASLNLAAGNRHWRLLLTGTVETGWLPLALAASGFLFSLLLATLVYTLARTGYHARVLARRMTRELSANRELLSSVSNNVRDGIYRGIPASGIVYINRTLARMLDYDDETSVQPDAQSLRRLDPMQHSELRRKLLDAHHYEDEEVEYVRADGAAFSALTSAWATCDSAGNVLYYDGVVTDISESKAASRRIRQMTYYDRLTGLPNQAYLEERFRELQESAGEESLRMAVLLMDLDKFKDINAMHGHGVGDVLLKQAASRLRTCLHADDVAVRIGGDEFIVLLRMAVDVATITQTANCIREALSEPYVIAGEEMYTTPSIGIALYPQDGRDVATLRQHAESALYEAKQGGRANIAYFARQLNEQARRQVEIENALHLAIERGEMHIYYQPRASVRDGTLSGVEALLRWQHPQWGEVDPEEFVPIAEHTGQIIGIGNWTLEQALRDWKEWAGKMEQPPRVGVNVSIRQLQNDSRFDETVASLLAQYGMPGDALELEITETMLVDHLQRHADSLSKIRALGARIALDDFGTGYSSLSYLSRFAVDTIKVDQSFIRGLSVDGKDAAIVRSVSILGRAMGAELVAEGVETKSQLKALRRMRYHSVQGYLLAPPMALDDLIAFMLRVQREGPPAAFSYF